MIRRATFVASALILLAASVQAAQTVSRNGDTATFMGQVLVCVGLLALAVYCKNRGPSAAD